MTLPSDDPNAQGLLPIEDATCPACGLLCDDITLQVAGDRIVGADRACERGRSWFLLDHRRAGLPGATADGLPVPIAEAIQEAAEILARAKAPVVTGLSTATVEAQAVAATLADRLGAAIGPSHSGEAGPRVSAIRRAGGAFASFGEITNRADVIILWGVDPSRSHPRLRERLIDRPGRFVPRGRGGRTVLVVDDGSSDARGWADGALAVSTGGHAEAFRAIRAAVRGIPADPGRVERSTGVPFESWRGWAERLRAARYAAVLFGPGLAAEGPGAIEALMRLLDDLNMLARCVAFPLAGPGNPAGAEAVLTGRLGAPMAIDLADGSPRERPGDAEPEARLLWGEADAVLEIGEPTPASDDDRPSGIPAILIGPGATGRSAPGVSVAISTATPAIDEGGSFVRSDEVTLPLRPALEPTRPSTAEVLRLLLDRIDARPRAIGPA